MTIMKRFQSFIMCVDDNMKLHDFANENGKKGKDYGWILDEY